MKRKLSKKEIKDILLFIKPQRGIPEDSAISICRNIKSDLEKQLEKIEIYPHLLPVLKQEIQKQYYSSLIQAGETVGILTAQSIGEKQTQSTLNSVDWTEKLIYMKNGEIYVKPIGEMVDEMLKNGQPEYYPKNCTEYMNISEKDKIFVPSCTKDGMCGWYKVEAVTRHYPDGKLVRVTTQSGRTVVATQAKSFLTWNGNEFVPTNGSDIKIGSILPTTTTLTKPRENKFFDLRKIFSVKNLHNISNKILLDKEFGFFVGLYLATGWVTKTFVCISNNNKITDYCDKYNITYIDNGNILEIHSVLFSRMFNIICNSRNKKVPEFAYNAPNEFINGLLDGYFGKTVNSKYITLSGSSSDLLSGISLLLTYFGVHSHIENSSIETSHTNNIAFPKDRDVYFDKVVSVEFVNGTTPYVYDLTVEHTRNFQLFNGINMRDTFHKAGSGEKQPTVSKFNDLLNASKEPKAPYYMVYFNNCNDSIQELRKTIGHSLVEITFKKIIKNWKICINKSEEPWYPAFRLFNDFKSEYKDCISCEVDMDILYEYGITLQKVAESIDYSDIMIVYSPDNIGRIDIFAKTDCIDIPDDEEGVGYVTHENAEYIYLEEVVRTRINEISICGIPGVNDMFFLRDGEKWMVELTCKSIKLAQSVVRFKQILAHPNVDMTKTTTSNLWDIYYTFGVHAVRQYMIEQFSSIMEGINICHVKLLVDKMVHTGTIKSISRYSMRSEESGPFSKASNEETLDNFITAAIHGQTEKVDGVSARIMCGSRSRIGTGLCSLMMAPPCIEDDSDSDVDN